MIYLTLQVAAAACLSCKPNATSPTQMRAAFEVQTPQPVAGCARISIHVDLNTSAVTVQDGTTCGQLVPERDTQPVFDASRRALRLPIVLRNATTGFVTAPVRLSFTADSIYRYRDGQQVPGSGSTRALNADSGSVNGRVASWRYDTLLAAAGETQRIAPGARSRRLWIEFTGPELWLKPGGADADTTLSLRLDASGLYQVLTEVPAVAPDTIPSWVHDDTSKVTDPRAPTFRFLKNIVTVTFKPGTTQPQRAAAISRVAGTVIGGRRFNDVDGIYVVLLPADPTNNRVFDAIRDLETDPAVSTAWLYWFMSGAATYLRPDDGTVGWARADWRVNRDSGYLGSIHPTWALEASNASRAWGCSLGDTLTRIAIIDQGVRASGFADLVPNVDTVVNGNQSGELFVHGANVAHVLAARGDNGTQMSGMMWRSRLSLYDASERHTNGLLLFAPGAQLPSLDAIRFQDALVTAANRGARVINISLGSGDTSLRVLPAPQALDSAYRKTIGQLVENERFHAQGRTPLYVISTGNVAGRDAYYSMLPILVDSLPDRVINVVGSDRARNLPWTPGSSSRIHVAAPGDSVGTWGVAGAIFQSGTSFATPLVAGVAGLLFSFDSTLTPAEVKQLIIQGAQAGGLTAGGVPLLDAYESLRLAAQRRRAPLCGNRLWGDSAVVVAERVIAGVPVDDTLATVPEGTGSSFLAPIHGGKRLFNSGFAATWREIAWSPGAGWALVTPPGPVADTAIGGTFWSAIGLDHDRTRVLFAGVTSITPGSPATKRYNFTLNPSPPTLTHLSAPMRAGFDTSTSAAVCVKVLGSGSCGFRVFPSYDSKVSVTMSPDGARGFYAITEIINRVVASGPTNTCLDDTAAQCTEFDIITEPMGPTQVFELDFAANTAVARWTLSGFVFRLGMSERNDEIVTTEGDQRLIQHHGWMVDAGGTGVDVPFVSSSTFSPNTCHVVFRDVRAVTPSWGQVRRQVAVRPSTACTLNTSRDGIGGIAPRIRRAP